MCLTLEIQGRDATVTPLLQVVRHLGDPLSLYQSTAICENTQEAVSFNKDIFPVL